MIHGTAIVHARAIGRNVEIGPFAVVEAGVTIGNDVTIHPHVVIASGVTVLDGAELFPGCVVGKKPSVTGGLSRVPVHGEKVTIGPGTCLGPHAVIYQDVHLGSRVLVGDGSSVREGSRLGDDVVVGRFVAINYSTTVGSRTKVMDHAWLAGNMTVGTDVFISGGVLTTNDTDFAVRGVSDRPLIGPAIEDGVSVGAGAILLPAIRIGRGAVVGAGAVVTKDVVAGETVMGVPARPRGEPLPR